MRRILILYIIEDGKHYSEGLIMFDGSVWTRDFTPKDNLIFKSLCALNNYLKCLEHIKSYNILEIDKKEG